MEGSPRGRNALKVGELRRQGGTRAEWGKRASQTAGKCPRGGVGGCAREPKVLRASHAASLKASALPTSSHAVAHTQGRLGRLGPRRATTVGRGEGDLCRRRVLHPPREPGRKAEGCSTCKGRGRPSLEGTADPQRPVRFPRGPRVPALTQIVEVPEQGVQQRLRAGKRAGPQPLLLSHPGRRVGWGAPPRCRPQPAGHPHFRVPTRCARASQVPARLPSWLRWRRPGSCGAAAEGAAALGEVGPPSAEEPPPAAAPPPPSKHFQAPPGTAAAPWILPVHPTLVSPSAPPVPALSCSSTR